MGGVIRQEEGITYRDLSEEANNGGRNGRGSLDRQNIEALSKYYSPKGQVSKLISTEHCKPSQARFEIRKLKRNECLTLR